MSFFGSIIPTGPTGAGGAERAVRKKREELRKGDDLEPNRRHEDTAQISAAEDLQETDRTHGVTQNDSEESHEEHMKHGVYGPAGKRREDGPRRLNVEG